MEQPCYKCAQPVEQGVPFCPHCSAPQIRVVVAEPAPSQAVLADSNATVQGAADLPASQTSPILAVPIRWSQALKPCLLSAFVGSLLMFLGLNPFVAMLCVGFLAVVFYRQRRPEIPIRAQAGAGLGVLGGLLWFALSSILQALTVIFLHKGPELRDELIKRIQQAASQTSDPQVLALFDRLKTPGGIEFLMIFGLVFGFISAIVLAALGGALGGSIFGRNKS